MERGQDESGYNYLFVYDILTYSTYYHPRMGLVAEVFKNVLLKKIKNRQLIDVNLIEDGNIKTIIFLEPLKVVESDDGYVRVEVRVVGGECWEGELVVEHKYNDPYIILNN